MKTLVSQNAISKAAQIILSLTISIFAAQVTAAQTNTFPSSGNTGVGTTTPESILTVQTTGVDSGGDKYLRIKSTNSFAGLLLDPNQSGDAKWLLLGGYPNAGDFTIREFNVANYLTIKKTTGYVGIGTASPTALLDLNGGIRLRQNPGGNAAATLIEFGDRHSNWAMGFSWNLYYDGTAWKHRNTDYGAILGLGDGTNQGDLLYWTAPSAAAGSNSSLTERFRITNSGNVGIGNSNPAVSLDIKSDNVSYGGQLRIAASDYGQITFFNSNDLTLGPNGRRGSVYYALASNKLDVNNHVSGAPVVLQDPLDSGGGNVGIGTASPGYKLDVQSGQINASGGLCIGGDCKTSWSQVGGGGGSSQWTTSSSNIYYNSGNVGIGTTSPSTGLEVGRNAGGTPTGITITGGSTVAAPVLYFNYADAGSNLKRWMLFGDINGNFSVATQPDAGGTASAKLFVSNGGNVGIGTTNPAATLHVTAGSADSITRVAQFYQPGLSSNNNYALISVGKANAADQAAAFGFLMNTAGNDSAFVTVAGDDPSAGTGLFVKKGGNVGIGTTNPAKKLHVAGDIQVDGNINAKYQDVAEWVPSSEQLASGTVVVLDATTSNEVIASTQAYDTRVAGVVSAKPGITLGEKSDGKVLVATTGRVRVKVDATKSPIAIGDLLVTSDVPGVAMKSEAVNLGGVQLHRPGTIIGKALEPLAKGSGEILVLLSLQ